MQHTQNECTSICNDILYTLHQSNYKAVACNPKRHKYYKSCKNMPPPHPRPISLARVCPPVYWNISLKNKKLIRRWNSKRKLSLRRHRTHTTKYNRLGHKFRQRSTWSCVGMQVFQSQWNNTMQRPIRRSRSFKVTDFGTNRKFIYNFLLVIILTYLLSCTISKL